LVAQTSDLQPTSHYNASEQLRRRKHRLAQNSRHGLKREPQPALNPHNPRRNLLSIWLRRIRVARVPRFVLPDQARKFLPQKRQKLLRRRWHQKQHAGCNPQRTGLLYCGCQRLQFALLVRYPGSSGEANAPTLIPASRSLPIASSRKSGRGARGRVIAPAEAGAWSP